VVNIEKWDYAGEITLENRNEPLIVDEKCAEVVAQLFDSHLISERNEKTKLEKLTKATKTFYKRLLNQGQFKGALDTAVSCTFSNGQPWRWQLLIDDVIKRIGLLTVFRFRKIPMHDHPRSFGVQLVLSGAAQVRQLEYQVTESQPYKADLVALVSSGERVLSAGEYASFTPTTGNIHEIAATTVRVVLLTVVAPPYDEHERSWYFSINGLDRSDSVLFANRVKKTSL